MLSIKDTGIQEERRPLLDGAEGTPAPLYRRAIKRIAGDPFFVRSLLSRLAQSRPKFNWAKGLYEGAAFLTDTAWPWAFAGLLLHDLVTYYALPNERYETTLLRVLGGTANNQQSSLSTWLGNDMPSEWEYSLWPALIGAMALAMGTVGAGAAAYRNRRKGAGPTIYEHVPRPLENYRLGQVSFSGKNALFEILASGLEKQCEKDCTATRLEEISKGAEGLEEVLQAVANYAGKTILFEDNTPRQEIVSLIVRPQKGNEEEVLIEEVSTSGAPSGEGAVRIFKIHTNYFLFVPKEVEKDDDDEEEDEERQEKQRGLALSLVRRLLAPLVFLPKEFMKWANGEAPSFKALEALFGAYVLYRFYAKARLFELWALKLKGLIEYMRAKSECESTGGQHYVFLKEWGDYYCTVCGEWPFVFINDRFSAQGCLDGLLQSSLPPTEIIHHLAVLGHRPISRIDVSRQALPDWTDSEWQGFLDYFAHQKGLKELNLSSPSPDGLAITKAKALAQFLEKVPVLDIDLGQQQLGAYGLSLLRPGLNFTTALRLSGNGADDAFLESLAGVPLEALVLQSSAFTGDGLDGLTDNFANLSLLDVSNNDLSTYGLAHFWQAIHVAHLRMSNCQLGPEQLPDLRLLHVGNLDLGHNPFSDEGAMVLFATSPNEGLQAIGLSYAQLTDVGIEIIVNGLGNITTLGLAGNELSYQSIALLCNATLTAKLDVLDLSGCGLADEEGGLIATRCQLTAVGLSQNALTDTTGVALAKGPIKIFRLGSNQLTEVALQAFVGEGLNATVLDLSDNQITEVGTAPKALKHAPLAKLVLKNNPLAEGEAARLVQGLISEVPFENPCNRDLMRAVRRARPVSGLKQLELPAPGPSGWPCYGNAALSRAGFSPELVFGQSTARAPQSFFAPTARHALGPRGEGGPTGPGPSSSGAAGMVSLFALLPNVLLGLLALYLLFLAIRAIVKQISGPREEGAPVSNDKRTLPL